MTTEDLKNEIRERRQVMGDIVRILGRGCCGMENNKIAPAVERLQMAVTEARALLLALAYITEDSSSH